MSQGVIAWPQVRRIPMETSKKTRKRKKCQKNRRLRRAGGPHLPPAWVPPRALASPQRRGPRRREARARDRGSREGVSRSRRARGDGLGVGRAAQVRCALQHACSPLPTPGSAGAACGWERGILLFSAATWSTWSAVINLTSRKKKERKQTTRGSDGKNNPREGWEDGTPPPHRDFKERSVVR